MLAGLLFIAVAAIGLWASRNYPIGTTTRMGTGYVPRLLCWILLGARRRWSLVQGLRDAERRFIQLGPADLARDRVRAAVAAGVRIL